MRVGVPSAGKRGMSLLEVMSVLAILGIIVGLAIPSLRPLQHTNKLNAGATVAVAFVDDARRLAVADARCTRVRSEGRNLVLERRMHADCVTMSDDHWEQVRRLIPERAIVYQITTTAGPTGAFGNIVFRPSSRLWGDGDLDVTDDAARVKVLYSGSVRSATVDVTSIGRVCARRWSSSAPTFSVENVRCDS